MLNSSIQKYEVFDKKSQICDKNVGFCFNTSKKQTKGK